MLTELLLLFSILIFGTFALAGYKGAPWVPTRKNERKRLIELLDLPYSAIVYDLGCGNGAVLFDIADARPDVALKGVELSLFPYLWAKIQLLVQRKTYSQVSIRYGSLYNQDISDADAVFVYLLSGAYERLLRYFEKQNLKADATIVIQGWPLPGKTYYFKNDEKGLLPLYFYRGSELMSSRQD